MAITFDFTSHHINLSAPHSTELTCQDLINAIRDIEDGEEGIQYGKIADASGKAALGGGVSTGISIALVDPWQLVYPAGNYQAVIKDGNLVGGLGGNPIAYTAGVQVKVVQSAAGTISTVTSGSGLDAEQSAMLRELWRISGLDGSNPMTVTKTARTAADINLTITGDGENTATVSRQ